MSIKNRVGIACVVVGAGALVAWPAVSARIAEQMISSRLEVLAEQGGYELVELDYDRGFSKGQVVARFQGKGLRSLAHEVVELDGTVLHGGVMDLPNLVEINGDVQFTQGEGASQYSYGGEVNGGISLWGNMHGTVEMAPAVFPVEGEEGVVAALDSYTVSFDGDPASSTQVFHLSPLTMRVEDASRQSFQLEASASTMHWDQLEESLNIEVPEVGLVLDGQKNQAVNIADLVINTKDTDENGVAGAAFDLSTGSVHVEGRKDAVLKSVAMRSSLENLDLDSLKNLIQAVQDSETVGAKKGDEKVMKAVYTLMNGQPTYNLDNLTLDTGHGVFSMNFSMSAKKGAGDVWRQVLGTSDQQTYGAGSRLMGVLDGEVGVQLDGQLIDWSCRSLSAMQVSDPLQVDMMTGMCGELIKKGHFFGGSCHDNSCRVKMSQVQKQWEKDFSLDASFDGRNITLNGVTFAPLELMSAFQEPVRE